MMAMILWILGLEYGYECEKEYPGMRLRAKREKILHRSSLSHPSWIPIAHLSALSLPHACPPSPQV